MPKTQRDPRSGQAAKVKSSQKHSPPSAPSVQLPNNPGRVPRLPFARELGRALISGPANDVHRTQLLRRIVQWARSKWADFVPDGAFAGQPFEVVRAGLHLEVSFDAETGIWGSRFEHLGEDGSTWVTEAMLAMHEDLVLLGVRNVVSRMDNAQTPLTMPRFLRECLGDGIFHDAAFPISANSITIDDHAAVIDLVKHLLDGRRALPVVLITQPKDAPPAFPPDDFAREVAGLAHVVAISPDANYSLSELVGTSWSAFNGSIRTYLPQMTLSDPLPRHKLIVGLHIAEFDGPEGKGAAGFRESLKHQLFAHSVSPKNSSTDFPTFAAVRRKAALVSARAQQASGDLQPLRESVQILEALNKDAESETRTWKQLAEEYDALREASEARVNELEAQVAALRHGLAEQRRAAAASASEPVDYPDSYSAIPAWVDTTMNGRLLLHQRAKRGLKNAIYEDPQTVAEALDLLATHYRNSRVELGDAARRAKQVFEQRCQELGLDVAKSISPTQAGEYEREYYVTYGTGRNSSRLLEWHLKKGNSRADRHCLRIYYFFDEGAQVVVVGSLPGHLENQLT